MTKKYEILEFIYTFFEKAKKGDGTSCYRIHENTGIDINQVRSDLIELKKDNYICTKPAREKIIVTDITPQGIVKVNNTKA